MAQYSRFIGVLFLFMGSSFQEKDYKLKLDNLAPPLLIKISDNLYYDRAEIDYWGWGEYTFWTKKVMGSESQAYKETMLKSRIWERIGYPQPMEIFSGSIPFWSYPVTGITFQQAQDYTKWRGDRVFENILIENGYLDLNSTPDSNSYFSTERFLRGEITLKKPANGITHYPLFRLPTKHEWEIACNYSDSITRKYQRKVLRMERRFGCGMENRINSGSISKNENYRFYPVHDRCFKLPVIYNLKGNLREISGEREVILGKGWCDSDKSTEVTEPAFEVPSECTGFRNVMEWVKLEKSSEKRW